MAKLTLLWRLHLLKDKKHTLIVAVFIACIPILLSVFLSYKVASLQKEVSSLEQLYNDISVNIGVLNVMSHSIKAKQKRLEEGKSKNFTSELEKIAGDLNIAKGLKKVNVIGTKKEGMYTLNQYELKFEGLDINTITNLLYRILNAPLLIKVERCNISVSFDKPNLMNVSLRAVHIN